MITEYDKTVSVDPKKRTKRRERKFSDSELINHARLKNLGTIRKKTFLYEEMDEKKREKFISALKDVENHHIVYIDESGVKNSITNEYAWSLRGAAAHGLKKGRAAEQINIIAGIMKDAIISPMSYDCNTNSEIFNGWLENILLPELPGNSVIIILSLFWTMQAFTRQRKQKKL